MAPDTLALIERKVARLRDDHIGHLLSISSEAFKEVDIQRKSTVEKGLELLLRRTSEALADFVAKVKGEVITVLEETKSPFLAEDKFAVLAITLRHFDESIYVDRVRLFGESLHRHFGRAGRTIDLSAFRPDLAEARLHIACSNRISRFASSFADDLELLVQRQRATASHAASPTEGKLEQVNKVIKIEPNFFGIGVNVNYLIRRWLGKKE